MCLYTTNKIQTTTKDTTVYKVVYHDLYKDGLTSPYYKFYYKWNTLYKGAIVIKTCARGINEVWAGFHTYSNYQHIRYNKEYIHYAIIPKGAEYCIGLDDDIVSNQIIVFKNKTQYLLSKLKRRIKL